MDLREYQRDGVSFLRSTKRAVLADEMGVGKTPQLIKAAEGRTLVVAPPPLHKNWGDEILRWMADPDQSFSITSYHGLVDMSVKDGRGHVAGKIKPEWRGPWDTLICDEAHHIKGRNTGYAKAVVKLAADTERVYLATGTPVRNWAHEVFMLLRAIHPGDPRFSSFWRWADRWFTVHEEERWRGKRKQTNKVVGGLRDITDWATFTEANGINGHWLRREIDDPVVGLELPPQQQIRLPVKMGAKQQQLYRSMERDFFATYEGKTITGIEGGQWSHLMRLASGVSFHPDLGQGPSAKLGALEDLMQPGSGPWVVFAWYQHTVEQLAAWARKQGFHATGVHGGMSQRKRTARIEEFKEGNLDVIVGSYPTLGEGHTLTRAKRTVLFEPSAVPAHIDQAKARIRRFGQDERTTVWTLVTDDTVDAFFVDQVLPAKRAEATAVIEAADVDRYREQVGR